MGHADKIEVQEIGNTRFTVVTTQNSRVNTIVLRGSSKNLLEDAERAIYDAVNGFRHCIRRGTFVAGAGMTEM